MDCASYITTALQQRPHFKLVLEPEFINVCFWYVPPSLQGLQEEPDFNEKLHKVHKDHIYLPLLLLYSYMTERNDKIHLTGKLNG
jgi:hypothetical protein